MRTYYKTIEYEGTPQECVEAMYLTAQIEEKANRPVKKQPSKKKKNKVGRPKKK